MKTTGQNATPKPDRECATCGTPLEREEYELCNKCRERLEDDYYERRSKPQDRREEW